MALKTVVESLDAVPEALREHYVEENGSFVLAHDGNDRIKEFRENNISLKKQAEELQTKLKNYDGVDPEKYRELTELERQKRDKELIEKGDVETLLNERLASERTTYQKQLDAINTELTKTRGELVATKVTDTLKTAAANAGVRPEAMDDVVRLASGNWNCAKGRQRWCKMAKWSCQKKSRVSPWVWASISNQCYMKNRFIFKPRRGRGAVHR